jgi:dihydrofolate synthase/folylpolyglutamate synthase
LITQPGQPRRKYSLDEIRILLAALNNPQQRFRSILIAGTNGKGSTAATLASILVDSGLRTGLYTSPHLERVNERIRVNRATISDDDFARHFFAVQNAAAALIQSGSLHQPPSFFETLTALAFLHFAESGVEIAVLEVGMGGRLDATNIVDPLLSILTDISLDHMEWLGDTIEKITREKAGILRPNGTLITLPQHAAANQVIGEVAAELNVRGVSAVPFMPSMHGSPNTPYTLEVLGQSITVDSPLIGSHQLRNRALAIAAAVELAENHNLPITPSSIESGIQHTEWHGRLERILVRIQDSHATEWILDVAHNPAGAWALRAGLNTTEIAQPAPSSLIFACLRDKPVDEMAQILFPLFNKVFLAPIHSPRATGPAELMAAADKAGTPTQLTTSVE